MAKKKAFSRKNQTSRGSNNNGQPSSAAAANSVPQPSSRSGQFKAHNVSNGKGCHENHDEAAGEQSSSLLTARGANSTLFSPRLVNLLDIISASSNDLMKAIDSNAAKIEAARKETAKLREKAQETRQLLGDLSVAISKELEQVTSANDKSIEDEDRKQQETLMIQEATKCLHEQLNAQMEKSHNLEKELAGSQELVAHLLQNQQVSETFVEQQAANAAALATLPATSSRLNTTNKNDSDMPKQQKKKKAKQKQHKKIQDRVLQEDFQKQQQQQQQQQQEREEDMERRRLIMQEKQEALLAQEKPKVRTSPLEERVRGGGVEERRTEGKAKGLTQSSLDGESRVIDGAKHKTLKSQIQTPFPKTLLRRATAHNTVLPQDGRLSVYIYPRKGKKKFKGISPIFEMLQDPGRLREARELLTLESEMKKRQSELRDLEKDRRRCEAAIASNQKESEGYYSRIANIDKEQDRLQGKWGTFNVSLGLWDKDSDEDSDEEFADEFDDYAMNNTFSAKYRAKKAADRRRKERKQTKAAKAKRMKELSEERTRLGTLISVVPARTESLRLELIQQEGPINEKRVQISEVREQITKRKGVDGKEDENFHIDGSRDENGHTFLMVAAQNNDVETAEVCFRLGADPDETSHEGFTAIVFADYFKFDGMVKVIAQHGGTVPKNHMELWNCVTAAVGTKSDNRIDWDTTLRIANQAAVPTEKIMASAIDLEMSEDSRMTTLSEEERTRDISFFENSLLDDAIDPNTFRRVFLISKDVYHWFRESETARRSDFLWFLDVLKPQRLRKHATAAQKLVCHRRAVVGIKNAYEILCAHVGKDENSPVVLFTPFVTSDVEGVTDIGVLVWAVTSDDRASLFKTLIESTDFLRHKVEVNERFPHHANNVLELGKDVNLLDLQSTSIFTSKPLELFMLDIGQGDVERLEMDDVCPKKRIAFYEQQLNRAIFEASEVETAENEAIMSGERVGVSTSLRGGAGTGKTLLMTKKVVSVATERKIMIVSRLPRLVSVIKAAVERERDVANATFSTYDDLLAVLARKVTAPTEAEHRAFSTFSQISFSGAFKGGENSSVCFLQGFVEEHLNDKERKAMKNARVQPMTLWTAFRNIKSNARCSLTKKPLSQEEYEALPSSFGLRKEQREVVYGLFLRYEEWLNSGSFKWDEADRVLYILKFGPRVFSEQEFVSWEHRAFQLGELELLAADGESPLQPFFYDMIFVDEAQDFTELDLALLLRMSSGVRSLFLGFDPAQSVELGIRMRAATIHDVFHNSLSSGGKGPQVKNVLQEINLRTNHRTHAQNLAMAKSIRRILARSFGVPESNENSLINGPIPEGLVVDGLKDLANDRVFAGGNIVFLAPDETVKRLRHILRSQGVQNDIFGVKEAKGLEFDAVAIIGFFSFIDALGSAREWENALRWLSSRTGITTTESSEKIQGRQLEDCDYSLSHPEIMDQAMLLYTALTRARNHLYIIEVKELGRKKRKGVTLENFAFRRLVDLDLMKRVEGINEGSVEMTPQEHKARGVLLVTQAISLSGDALATSAAVKDKFIEAADRFRPDKGNDSVLLDQCQKHMEAVLLKRSLIGQIRTKFFNAKHGTYDLCGKFADVLRFEKECSKFFSMCAGDSFLANEIGELRSMVEDLFAGTPFEVHFGEICSAIKRHEP